MEATVLGTAIELDRAFLDDSPATVREQLQEYARGDRRSFELGVSYPDGFLGRVMRAMSDIPYGETRTYGKLAEQLDTAALAVGQACGRNPVPVIVPCHRVVASDGIGGYRHGELKERLLQLEDEEATKKSPQTASSTSGSR